MNRVRFGAAILLALVLLCSGTAWYVRQETKILLQGLDEITEIAATKSIEEAEPMFAAFEAQWERAEKILNFMVLRERVLQVDITISHLHPMLLASCDELASELSEAKMWLERLGQSELPTLWNIL